MLDQEPDRSAEQTPRRTGVLGVARKAAVGLVGGTVTLVGVVMLPAPGPGTPIVIAGLAILATEFPSVRRRLDKGRKRMAELLDRRS